MRTFFAVAFLSLCVRASAANRIVDLGMARNEVVKALGPFQTSGSDNSNDPDPILLYPNLEPSQEIHFHEGTCVQISYSSLNLGIKEARVLMTRHAHGNPVIEYEENVWKCEAGRWIATFTPSNRTDGQNRLTITRIGWQPPSLIFKL